MPHGVCAMRGEEVCVEEWLSQVAVVALASKAEQESENPGGQTFHSGLADGAPRERPECRGRRLSNQNGLGPSGVALFLAIALSHDMSVALNLCGT